MHKVISSSSEKTEKKNNTPCCAAFEAVLVLCLQSQSIDLNGSPLLMLQDGVLAHGTMHLAVRDTVNVMVSKQHAG